MECYVCDSAEQVIDGFSAGYVQAYAVLADLVLAVLAPLVVGVIMYRGIRMMMGISDGRQLGDHITDALLFSFFAGTITASQYLWDPVFGFFLNIGPSLGIELAERFGLTTDRNGLIGLLAVGEKAIFRDAWEMITLSYAGGGFFNINLVALLGAILLLVAIFLFLWQLLKTIIGQMIMIFAVGSLSPVILGFGAFPAGRVILAHALKIFITSAAQLMLGCMALGIVLSIVHGMQDIMRPADPRELSRIGSPSYLSLLLTMLLLNLSYGTLVSVPSYIFQTFIQSEMGSSGPVGAAARIASSFMPGGAAVTRSAGIK